MYVLLSYLINAITWILNFELNNSEFHEVFILCLFWFDIICHRNVWFLPHQTSQIWTRKQVSSPKVSGGINGLVRLCLLGDISVSPPKKSVLWFWKLHIWNQEILTIPVIYNISLLSKILLTGLQNLGWKHKSEHW